MYILYILINQYVINFINFNIYILINLGSYADKFRVIHGQKAGARMCWYNTWTSDFDIVYLYDMILLLVYEIR